MSARPARREPLDSFRRLLHRRGRVPIAKAIARDLGVGYRLDVVVEDSVIVELKAVEHVTEVHVAQVITYLKVTGLPAALLVNFNVRHLRDGLRGCGSPAERVVAF